jgi:hypothetical protein
MVGDRFDTNLTVNNSISNMDEISADSGSFKNMTIDGDLTVDGKIKAKEIDMLESKIVLNFDYEYIENTLENMDSLTLEFFMKHLERLKLLTEKKLLDRS